MDLTHVIMRYKERGGRVGRLYVVNGDDAKMMTRLLLEAIGPEKGLDKGARIGLKPNLVVAKGWKSGATTNPKTCEAIIEYFLDRHYSDICIIESSWLAVDTRNAFKACGYDLLAKKYGIRLVDAKKDQHVTCEYGGMNIDISKHALETDYLINLPLVKGHCQTNFTCALKNMKGLIPDREKRRFHAMGLHKPIAYLNKMISPALTIADGIYTDPHFEEGGNPVRMNTMIAGMDSVLIDVYASGLLGYDIHDVGYLKMAAEIGVGSPNVRDADIVYLNGANRTVLHTRIKALESAKSHIIQQSACSACYGNLISALLRLDTTQGLGDIKICVGQDFRGKKGDIGCGNCTDSFDYSIKGCPPDIDKIEKELKKIRGKI
ncbi:MAG: DUF362 domain-containing protein [Christensenellales bacterium]|jgi:uncharacterized protein (DUF362 family)